MFCACDGAASGCPDELPDDGYADGGEPYTEDELDELVGPHHCGEDCPLVVCTECGDGYDLEPRKRAEAREEAHNRRTTNRVQ